MELKVKAFIILTFTLSLMQLAYSSDRPVLTGLFQLKSAQVSGKLEEANIFGLSLGLDFSHQLSKLIAVKARGGASLETGESESVYTGRSFEAGNSLFLEEALVALSPIEAVRLELGAINQGLHNNPLFLTNTPFVAVREIFSLPLDNWTLQLDMIQGIPSNYSLSKRLGNVEEGSSRFFNEKIRVIAKGKSASMNASFGHFAFDRLNSSIAYNSRLLGNSVSGVGSVNNKFRQGYAGWNGDLGFSYHKLSYVEISLESAFHSNERASAGKKLGYIIGPKISTKNLENNISFRFKSFKNEADSTVAFYSSKYTGQTNRKGLLAGLEVENKKMNLSYGADAYLTRPIEANPFQEKERIIKLSLRKSYDFL